MKKDYIFSLLTQFIVMISFLFTYKLISFYYGDSFFEQYSLLKRIVTFVIAFIGFGMFVSLIRNISYSKESSKEFTTAAYMFTIILIVILTVLVYTFDAYFYYLFDAINLNIEYLYAMIILIMGMMLHNIVYAYFRGKTLYKYANLYDIISKAIAPFVSVLIANNLLTFLYYHGIYQILLSFLMMIKIGQFTSICMIFKEKIMILLRYGIKRVLSDIGLNFIFLLPLLFVNKYDNGLISFYITIMIVVGYLYTPLNNIILSRLTIYFKEKNYIVLKANLLKIYSVVVISSMFIVIIMIMCKAMIISFFIATFSNELLEISNFYFISIFFYVVFMVNKNLIDAYTDKSINSKIVFVSICLFVIFGLSFMHNTFMISIIFLIMIFSLFFLSSLYVIQVLKKGTV